MSTLNYIDENGNINKVGVIPKGYPASNIGYNNSQSELTAEEVQEAIDEVVGDINIISNKINYFICKRIVYTSGHVPGGGDIGISYPVPTGYIPIAVCGDKYFTENGVLSQPSVTTNGYSYTRWHNLSGGTASLDGKSVTFYYVREDAVFE